MGKDKMFEDDEDESKDLKKNPDELAILNMVRNADGRAYIWNYLQSCCVFENIFSIDPIQHAYNAGLRESGLKFVRDIKAYEPDYYVQMIKENINE